MDGEELKRSEAKARWAQGRLRQRSKAVFGNADRVQVANAVGCSSGLVHAQELALQLEMTPSRVRSQLLALCEAGLLVALPRESLKQNYQRVDDQDPFWELVKHLAKAWG